MRFQTRSDYKKRESLAVVENYELTKISWDRLINFLKMKTWILRRKWISEKGKRMMLIDKKKYI